MIERPDPSKILCIVFDFGFTLSSDLYFNVSPPEYPSWQSLFQEHIFSNRHIVNQWMVGALTTQDIARIISKYVDMDVASIVRTMEEGCKHLSFNEAVFNFAVAQRSEGRKTALVTANMDVFTNVVVPSHGLDRIFDVILNTSDYKELRKEVLWPIAFELLGDGIHYENSLLVEDGEKEPALFRKHGGYAYQYRTDEEFAQWIRAVGFQSCNH